MLHNRTSIYEEVDFVNEVCNGIFPQHSLWRRCVISMRNYTAAAPVAVLGNSGNFLFAVARIYAKALV